MFFTSLTRHTLHKKHFFHYLCGLYSTYRNTQTMRKVIGIGETVLDIIFKNGQPVSAVPGGSVYNGIISLGRAGVPAAFVSEVGDDRIGCKTVAFLKENGVDAKAA